MQGKKIEGKGRGKSDRGIARGRSLEQRILGDETKRGIKQLGGRDRSELDARSGESGGKPKRGA